MRKILIIDDDVAFLRLMSNYIEEHYPALELHTCADPLKGLAAITTDLDLLLIDLEMPQLDGRKLLSYAISVGIDRGKIIILSGRDAEYLHKHFPMGTCLAVLNKYEVRQKEVLNMIFSALHRGVRGSAD